MKPIVSGLKDLMKRGVVVVGDIRARLAVGSFSAMHEIGELKYCFCIKKNGVMWFKYNM